MSTPANTISPDELKRYFSYIIDIADNTNFNTKEVLTEETLNEMPELRKRSLPQLIRLSQGLLLEVAKAFETGRETFDFLKGLSPSVLAETFYFARMHGAEREKAINTLGKKLGGFATRLPGFNPEGSRYHDRVHAMLSSSDSGEGMVIHENRLTHLFEGGNPLHYSMFNHLCGNAGKNWIKSSLVSLWDNPAGEKELAQKIGLVLAVDPDAREDILKLVKFEQLNLHHDQTPHLRQALGQKNLTPSECSARFIALIESLDRELQPLDARLCARAITDCPRYREHALVTDWISTMRENIKTHKSVQTKAQFEASRLAALETLMGDLRLSQDEINQVACQGMLELTGGDYLDLMDTGPAFAVIAMLDRHASKEDWSPGRDYANRVFLLGLLKHSDPLLLKQAASLKEDHAVLLYAITGKSMFLKFVKNESNRDKVFSGDLGL